MDSPVKPSECPIEQCATFCVFPGVISGKTLSHLEARSVLPKDLPSPIQKAGVTNPLASVYRPGLGGQAGCRMCGMQDDPSVIRD